MTARAARFPGGERTLLLGAIGLGIALRAALGWQTPLWLDETYTAVIASQRNGAGLYDWCAHELSGPLFYGLAWLAARVGGVGDVALRLPSMAAAMAAPLLIAWRGHPEQRLRLVWAALFALWIPGIEQATQARPQALLGLLAAIAAIAFLRAWRAPGRGALLVWATASAAMLLIHVYAAVPGGLQGLALLWARRDRLARDWPIGLVFVPVVAWFSIQLPFLVSFARPDIAWYPVLGIGALPRFAPDVLGGDGLIAWMLTGLCVALAVRRLPVRAPAAQDGALAGEEIALALSGVVAVCLIFGLGMVRPSYAARYMVPCAPACLFAVALLLCRVRQISSRLILATLVLLGVQAAALAVAHAPREAQREMNPLEFEQASAWLMQGPDRHAVIFAWDNPTAVIDSDAQLTEIGGFFFRRAHQDRQIALLRPPSGSTAAAPLAAVARARGADIMWIGGREWPEALMQDRGFSCVRFHPGNLSQALACRNITRAPGT